MLYKINESTNTQKLYFLSKDNMNNKTLSPRIPDNYFTKNNYEDNKTKRVCFAPSIDKALLGLSTNINNMEIYVHIPENEIESGYIIRPSTSQVPDSKITHEIWVTKPVKLKYIGKIKIIGTHDVVYKYRYGENEGQMYKWKWKWLEKDVLKEADEQLVPYNNHICGKDDLYNNIGQFAQGDDFMLDMVDPQSEFNRGSLFIQRLLKDNFIKRDYTIQEIDLNDDIIDLEILTEFTQSDKFSDVRAVIRSLSDEEKKHLAPGGEFKDTNTCIYKKVYKNGTDKMGFIYLDLYPEYEGEAFIGIAVSPKYRGQNLTKTMIDDAIKFLSNKKIKKLIWTADKNNIASNKAAINLGFRKANSYDIYNNYEYTLKNKTNESYIEEAAVERKFKCPFCDYRDTKANLVSHVDDEHEEMIPHGFTAARTVYNYINKTDGGHCIYCKGETEWVEDRWKYKRICIKKVCKQQASKAADVNMKKVYGKTAKEMLEDPNHQNKMLAGRRISGEYDYGSKEGYKVEDGELKLFNFKGQMKSYVGQNELKLLEFYDKVIKANPEEIQTPGPVIEYTYKGKKHQWITDLYYVTANLVHDAKDGGDNPNNREMKEYREKQIAKEKAIAEQGKYNYVRVTNNQFDQLFEVLSELKKMMIDDDIEEKTICKINEYMNIASINPVIGSGACIVNYGINGQYAGMAFTKDRFMSKIYTVDPETNKVVEKSAKDIVDRYDFEMYMNDDIKDSKNIITQIESDIEDGLEVSHDYFYKLITGKDLLDESQLANDPRFTRVLDYYSYMNEVNGMIRESLLYEFKLATGEPILALESDLSNHASIFQIKVDFNGIYMVNTANNKRSRYYDTMEDVPLELNAILK